MAKSLEPSMWALMWKRPSRLLIRRRYITNPELSALLPLVARLESRRFGMLMLYFWLRHYLLSHRAVCSSFFVRRGLQQAQSAAEPCFAMLNAAGENYGTRCFQLFVACPEKYFVSYQVSLSEFGSQLCIISGPLCWNWYSSANKRHFCAKI